MPIDPRDVQRVYVFTTAPRAYDYGRLVIWERDIPYTCFGARVREVKLSSLDAEHQRSRYLSGSYVACSGWDALEHTFGSRLEYKALEPEPEPEPEYSTVLSEARAHTARLLAGEPEPVLEPEPAPRRRADIHPLARMARKARADNIAAGKKARAERDARRLAGN